MAEYLSDAWLEDLDRALGSARGATPPAPSRTMVLEQHVTGTPRGDRAYHVTFGSDGTVSVAPGGTSTPTIRLTTDHATAVAVARGEERAQTAFLGGRMRLAGDVRELSALQELIGRLGAALGAVRAATSFPEAG